ncbi:MAG: hypothetical protein KDD56_09710 [Bdellovibrionales bacterium]|nr:hypothetical protein [Bdellovibrionales bacterium]
MKTSASVLKSLQLVLLPLAKLCLETGISSQDFIQIIKKAFISEALNKSQDKNSFNVSKVSSLTGINRREISNLITQLDEDPNPAKFTILTRVVGHWVSNSEFHNEQGNPKPLSYGTNDSEFHYLVSQISKDISPGTISTQLLDDGTATVINGKLALNFSVYNPKENFAEAIEMLSADLNDLVNAVLENVTTKEAINHHLTTEYDSIPIENVDTIRSMIKERGHDLHREISDYLKKLETTPVSDPNEKCKVVFCSFSRVKKNE